MTTTHVHRPATEQALWGGTHPVLPFREGGSLTEPGGDYRVRCECGATRWEYRSAGDTMREFGNWEA